MGSKPSNIFQMDRPESGGADRDDERESSGLLDRAKEEFAVSEARKKSGKPGPTRASPDSARKPKRKTR